MSETREIKLVLPKRTYIALKHAAEEKHKTESELAAEAIQAYLVPIATSDSFIGFFAKEAELLDTIVEDAMRDRENRWRQG